MQKTLTVSVVGVPNAGKSTLINNLINEKISAISSKPHTTRNIVQGILTEGEVQLIFLDTPGFMRNDMSVNNHGDVICFIIDGLNPWAYKVKDKIKSLLSNENLLIFINKIDAISANTCLEIMEEIKAIGYTKQINVMSGLFRRGMEEFKGILRERALDYPHLFEKDVKHTLTKEEIIKECVREKIFHIAYHELPYDTSVEVKDLIFSIDEKGKGGRSTNIRDQRIDGGRRASSHDIDTSDCLSPFTKQERVVKAVKSASSASEMTHTNNIDQASPKAERVTWRAYVNIYVQKRSQQAILVGKNGSVIKKIGQSSRLELCERFGPGHLFLKIELAR